MITANEAKYISDGVKRDKRVVENAVLELESLIKTSSMAGTYSVPCVIEKSQNPWRYVCDEIIRILKENGYLFSTMNSVDKIIFNISWE